MRNTARRPIPMPTEEEEAAIQRAIAQDPDTHEATDEELAQMRPAREVLPAEFFEMVEEGRKRRGRPQQAGGKKQVTLRLDSDVLDSFKSEGDGWQSRINEALRRVRGL